MWCVRVCGALAVTLRLVVVPAGSGKGETTRCSLQELAQSARRNGGAPGADIAALRSVAGSGERRHTGA
jgi:hypothetical protein